MSAAARPRSLSRGAARDLRVDRDARSERERARDSREVLRGLEAIHDREGPIGPPVVDSTPNQHYLWRSVASERREREPGYWFAESH